MPVLNNIAGAVSSRMPKALSPKAHAIADYIVVGSLLLAGALFWRKNKRAAMSALICGGAELALNLLTDYPGGIRKVIHPRTHERIDLGLAAMTAAMPEFMEFDDDKKRHFFLLQSGAVTVLANLTEFNGARRLRRSRAA
ncbi:MAG: hypothetical protein DMG68_18725 [Acidobacteria bacterium]|nr:MAG: hypothetical protein DMG68_18725 [Acidobacteriota bacterium]